MQHAARGLALPTDEFRLFQQLLLEESGLCVGADRQEFFRVAMADRLTALKLSSFLEYFNFTTSSLEGRREIQILIDAVTVGETYFFRNQCQFDWLRTQLLPQLVQQRLPRSNTLNVWSAGCATGEEPYSIAIALLESLPFPDNWRISILASDVNREFLKKAEAGVYGARAVRLVPPAWRDKYFARRGDTWCVTDTLKRLVRFTPHNLARDPFTLPGMQDVDALFCRNVMIYFPLQTATGIVGQFADCVRAGGHLFLGDTETLWQISDRFRLERCSNAVVYRKEARRGASDLSPFVAFQELIAHSAPVTPSSLRRPLEMPARRHVAAETGGWLATPDGGHHWPGASAPPGVQ